MVIKRQTKKQIKAGKYYQKLKDEKRVIGSIRSGKWYGFNIIEQSRKERKITFQTMMKNWFR